MRRGKIEGSGIFAFAIAMVFPRSRRRVAWAVYKFAKWFWSIGHRFEVFEPVMELQSEGTAGAGSKKRRWNHRCDQRGDQLKLQKRLKEHTYGSAGARMRPQKRKWALSENRRCSGLDHRSSTAGVEIGPLVQKAWVRSLAYKNVLAIAIETDYSFPLADKVKEYLEDPSKFVVVTAAPVAAAGFGDVPAAAKEEEKDEPTEQSDDDTGFSLFD
uniref:Uncharacterized protein LOC104233898 n=1 Tax=Nicotiana sylvestris TaxID=4096 RepID=A0A1U7X7K6_NICSY|nr:PREDICTED: uncharacterized protein LOC104233898 [Nicotiana sylvestris]